MNHRRILLSFALMLLALVIALSGVVLMPTSRELIVPIDRSALDASKMPKAADLPIPSSDISVQIKPSAALTLAPDPRLIEAMSLGHLPRKAENGDRPADVYARPVDPNRVSSSRPKLSIAILHAGISQVLTAEALITLPPDVSFVMSPYAGDAERLMRDIRNRGHEIFLEVQAKTNAETHEDRGPYALDPDLDVAQNRDRLHWMMSRMTGYVGLVGDLTRPAAQSVNLHDLIKRETASRGLETLSFVRASSSESELHSDAMSAHRKASLLLLPGEKPDDVKAALQSLTIRLTQERRVIAFIDPGPFALDALKAWLAQNQNVEFDLIPLSALLRLEGQG